MNTAPTFRAVDQHTGTIASLESALVIVEAANAERDKAIRQRDDARAELDNMMESNHRLGKAVDLLTGQCRDWYSDRNEAQAEAEEWRERYEIVRARLDEVEAELGWSK